MKVVGGKSPRLFVFGLGYSAMALTEELSSLGWRIAGTTREAERCHSLSARGIDTYCFDRDTPLVDVASALAGTTHLLSSVPPDNRGDSVLDVHGTAIAALDGLEWVGYLSTTGVYGDRGGAWVDEGAALKPTSDRSRRRVNAETAWLSLWRTRGLPVHLFRLAGIYGPGRSALDTVRTGRAKRIYKPDQRFSRIHVADIVQVLRASMAQPNPGSVYNVCDDDPAPPQDIVEFACELLGVDPPPLVPFDRATLSPMARSFYADNRRVCNDRIKRELGVVLRYPDYRTGLRSLLRDM